MATKLWAIVLMFFCTLITSSAQITYKFGLNQADFNTKVLIIGFGLFLYGIGAGLLIIALKGGDLSVLYPIVATSYVWVSVAAFFFFGESLGIWKWFGVFLILVGVSFIGKGGGVKK
jgi:undecaprenyl phosphate-alpha-L-ara4N flippase subunit ArnE